LIAFNASEQPLAVAIDLDKADVTGRAGLLLVTHQPHAQQRRWRCLSGSLAVIRPGKECGALLALNLDETGLGPRDGSGKVYLAMPSPPSWPDRDIPIEAKPEVGESVVVISLPNVSLTTIAIGHPKIRATFLSLRDDARVPGQQRRWRAWIAFPKARSPR
jgi:hypothetical protein